MLTLNSLKAQVNLVPNGSFEEYDDCPNSPEDQVLNQWFVPTLGSADYFNFCSNNNSSSIPLNESGYQLAQDGNAYIGLIIYFNHTTIGDDREYIEVKLDTFLIAGQKYFWCMYVCLSEQAQYASDNIGIALTNNSINNINITEVLNIQSYGIEKTIIKDTVNWIKIGGDFISTGGERYLIIGNFLSNIETESIEINSNVNYGLYSSYYLIDNVYLGTEPCLVYNSSVEIPNVFTPNNDGVNDAFKLQLNDVDSLSYQIFNRWGNLIYSSEVANLEWDGTYLNSECLNGVYYCIVQYYNKELNKTEQKQGCIHLIR